MTAGNYGIFTVVFLHVIRNRTACAKLWIVRRQFIAEAVHSFVYDSKFPLKGETYTWRKC